MEPHPQNNKSSELEAARAAAEACDQHHGRDIYLYDLKESSMLADFYLICTGTSEPHLKALADHIEERMALFQRQPQHIDGSAASRWIVVDYGYLVIHLFMPAMRRYYELENLWQDTAEIIYASATEDGEDDKPIPVF